MNEQDMIDKLKLTPKQLKAFNSMKRALRKFELAGGKLIGNDCFQYAVNGYNVDKVIDGYSNIEDESVSIQLDRTCAPSIRMDDPFIDSSPFVIVVK